MPAQSNALSFLGRMGYWTHMAFYPTVYFMYSFGYAPYSAAQAELKKKKDWEDLVAAKPVDPDTFNPFTPVPFHNNPELNYVYAHINMRDYVNENHINVKDYMWKSYHDSYDHGNQRTHKYNFTRVE